MHRSIPEFNRICVKKSRDRAYQQHIDALKKIKSCIDNKKPKTPQTIGRNCKRYEMEQQKCMKLQRDNNILDYKIRKIQREEYFQRTAPQRPFTLHGQHQKEEMLRINYENGKLLKAIETRRPTLSRDEWRRHRLDHTYQVVKNSEFQKTVPMSDILRQEFRGGRPQTATGRRSIPTKASKKLTGLERKNNRAASGLVSGNEDGCNPRGNCDNFENHDASKEHPDNKEQSPHETNNDFDGDDNENKNGNEVNNDGGSEGNKSCISLGATINEVIHEIANGLEAKGRE